MSIEIISQADETHKALTQHYAALGQRYKNVAVDAPSWTTSAAEGAVAYVFAWLIVTCKLTFLDGLGLRFEGQGLSIGLGATGSLTGHATFNIDPSTLKVASGITFEAWGLSAGAGGFQIAWYKDNVYIGHGEFVGGGLSLGAPGGGWGTFS